MPRTEAGKRLLAAIFALDDPEADPFVAFPMDPAALIAAIEAEAVAAERAHWHRTPGTYRTEHGTEVVVDLPESLSWLADEFPDEVNALVAAERERITREVEALATWDKRSVPGGFHVSRAAVLAIVNGETPK